MKKYLLLLNLLLLVIICRAQQETGNNAKKLFSLTGKLEDSIGKAPILNATVSLISVRDSALVAFTRSDSLGRFSFNQLQNGSYRLSVSHSNFQPLWRNFETTTGISIIDIGPIFLKDKNLLQELTVTAQRPAVEVNGDTLEFNSESFKTKPNAVVEDMLKKMPGVEVDKDGTVKVNGKKINRVLVNGKDFFNEDPKLATRNLPADAVDKVQVFEKKSDQAEFTGIDDGNAEQTINLKLKKDKKNAAFGKISAAAGTQSRYDGQFNINKFKDDQQLSVIGMANNSNRQGFSLMDMLNFTGQAKRMMGGGGGIVINTGEPEDFGLPVSGISNKQGITTTVADGINYSNVWKKKTDINTSYFYNNQQVDNDQLINRQYIIPGNNFTWKQNSSNNTSTQGNRFNFSADHKIDSFNSIKLTGTVGYQKGNIARESEYKSSFPNGKLLNNGITNTTNATEGYNLNNSILFRHKFKKRSRTFSINGNMQYNDSRMNATQYSVNNFFKNAAIDLSDTLNQVSKLNSNTQSYGVNANYTEPLSKRSLLEIRGFYNTSSGDVDRRTFDYNETSGKHDVRNSNLSNAFQSNYLYTGGGISIRTQQKKYGFSAGANLQYASLLSKLKDNSFSLKQGFTNLLPMANFNYSFTKMKTLRMDYNTSTSQPNASQLQPVKDISDPLNVREGNPLLEQQYSHNLNVQFLNANPARQKNLFAFLNYYSLQNAIVNSDTIDSAGTRLTKPVNASGVFNITAMVERGIRIKKLNTRFSIGTNIAYNRAVNYINQQKNTTGNLSIAPRVSANYSYKDFLDIDLSARIAYNKARYSLQPVLNNNFWRQTYNLEATLNLPGGLTIYNEFTYSVYTGRSDGFNTRIGLWNASLSKQVLKSKKGEIKLSGFDLLKQNVGVDRNANNNFIEDIQYQALQRFFTLGFTYSLQKAAKGGPRAIIRTF
ncbi:MAG: TonB-dependent receptor [Ferruginibacter sp.]